MRRYILTIAIVGLTPMSASAQSTGPSNIAIARQIASEISQVKAAATPAEWLREHPDEKLQTFHGRQLVNDTTNWCTRTFVRHEIQPQVAHGLAMHIFTIRNRLPQARCRRQERRAQT
jgi:hypothetical protein